MNLRVSSVERDGVMLFGFSSDDQARLFIRLTIDEAEILANELREVRRVCEQVARESAKP